MGAANKLHPAGLPQRWREVLDEELSLIRKCNFACYFLTVHDIVNFARTQDPPILCQGRGSAANSLVCYLLEITSIDPIANNLLFTRFLSEERSEEHTSELQSLMRISYAVFCLKKKKQYKNN